MDYVLEHNKIMNNIMVDNRLASMMENITPEYIFHVIQDSVNMKYRPNSSGVPNIVYSYEQYFIACVAQDPSCADEIETKKIEVYRQIIEYLCSVYQLEYHPSDNIYSDAFYMYQFLVSDFTTTVINFFVSYIIAEKKSIYDRLNLSEEKKNKDAATQYSKKIIDDQKVAIIHANVIPIVNDICNYNISLYDVIMSRYYGADVNIGQFLCSIIADKGTFFASHIAPYTRGIYLTDTINSIKLSIQTLMAADINPAMPSQV